MGLDVTVYNNIRKTESEDDYDFIAFVIDDSWKWKVKNLEYNAAYCGDSMAKAAGYSYSTHSRFREVLIKIIDRKDLLDRYDKIIWDKLPENIPFYDFIDFADNEGCLDWEVSKIIYKDFVSWFDSAKIVLPKYGLFWLERYEEWMEAFKSASENKGVVEFH